MQKKTRKELETEAQALGMDLSYFPEVVIPNIFKIGEEEWQKTMKDGIGSSGAAAAIGKSPYKTPLEVALEKSYGKSKPIGSDPDTEYRLSSGHHQEVPLLKWYAASLGYVVALTDPRNPSTSDIKDVTEITKEEWNEWKGRGIVCVDHARYRHPDYPFMFTDMDGVCFTPEGEMYVLECKTADSKDFKWKWNSGVWPNASVGNSGYIDQARQHMCVANADRCDIIAACGFNAADNVIVTIYRDMKEEKNLIDKEAELWKKVEDGVVPSFTTLSDRSYENVSYIITPESLDETPLQIPEANRSIIKEIFELDAEIKSKEAEIEERENRINALKASLITQMQGHSLGIMAGFNDGYEVKLELKSRTTTTIDSKRFKLEEPEIAERFLKTTTGDPKLTVKETKIKAKKVS